MSNLLYLHSISAFHVHEDSSKSTSLSEQDFLAYAHEDLVGLP